MSSFYIEQSKEWGEFQQNIPGRGKSWLINFANSRGNLDSALLIKQKLPFGKCWLWCPRGPILENYEDETAWHTFVREAQIIAYQEKALFLRVEPPVLSNEAIKWPNGFKKAHDHYLPEHTQIIDLTQTEERILTQMKPKGRYNIRLAEKKGIKIKKSHDLNEDLEHFYRILKETTTRDGFSGHNFEYYQNMLKSLSNGNLVELFLAEYENEFIGGIIVTFYQGRATYYFGASSNQHRNLMAPYLLQWEAIKEAKRRQCTVYDLLGIAPSGSKKSHPWYGITEFKNKFGGQEISYHSAKEYIFKPIWFKAMKLYKRLR